MNLLPQSSDAEQGVLGSFLIAPLEVGRICAERKILAAHFFVPAHAVVFAVLLGMWSASEPIDVITVTQQLRDQGKLDGAGGPAAVSGLFCLIPTAANVGHYLEILEEKLVLRKIISVCTRAGDRSMTEQDNLPDILAQVQSEIAGIGTHQAVRIPTMRENIMEAVEALEGRLSEGTSIIRTGLAELDNEVGPLERGNLFVIGGQTKAGKSILAAQIALNIAMSGKPVLIVSLEMSERELTLRMLSTLSRVNIRTVRLWSEAEHARFNAASVTLAGVPMTIIARRHALPEIVAVCQQFAAKPGEPLGAIVLDYAQLAEGTKSRKDDRKQQEIAEISKTCKRLAGSLNVLFILLTQLNDDGRTREARDIEMDANLLVEVGHNRDTGERGVKVVLARSAPSGQRLKLRIIPEHTRVEDWPDMDIEPESPKPKKRNWHDR